MTDTVQNSASFEPGACRQWIAAMFAGPDAPAPHDLFDTLRLLPGHIEALATAGLIASPASFARDGRKLSRNHS